MSLGLPRRKKEILRFIRRYIEQNGFAPNLTQIAKNFEINLPTAHEHLEYLHCRGLIEFQEGRAGNILLIDEKEKTGSGAVNVPLVGFITAGEPIEAIENREDEIPVPKEIVYGKECYLLKVKGDSMIESFIVDGDLVVVEKTDFANNGDTVVALLEDGTTTLKKFYKDGPKIRLQPANPIYKPIYANNVSIQGRVVGIIRKYY